MTGFVDRIEVSTYAGVSNQTRYAPFNKEAPANENKRQGSWVGVLAAFLVLGGLTVLFSWTRSAIVANYGIREETLLGITWVLQGMVALICFILAVRWLRS